MKLLTLGKTGFIWLGMLWSVACYGQRIEIPLGALPMQYNGSFAGEAGGPRISSNFSFATEGRRAYEKQRNYMAHISYDQFIPQISSGIGFSAGYRTHTSHTRYYDLQQQRDYNIRNEYTIQYYSFAFAPKFSIKGKYTLSPSVDLTYTFRKSLSETPGGYEDTQYYTLNSKAGLLFNTSKYYIGYSVILADRSDLKYFFDSMGLNNRFTSFLQMGYTFQRSSESKFSVTPQVAIQIGNRGRFQYHSEKLVYPEAYTINFRYEKFIWGISNAGLHVGLQTNRLKAMIGDNFGFATNNNRLHAMTLALRYTFTPD